MMQNKFERETLEQKLCYHIMLMKLKCSNSSVKLQVQAKYNTIPRCTLQQVTFLPLPLVVVVYL